MQEKKKTKTAKFIAIVQISSGNQMLKSTAPGVVSQFACSQSYYRTKALLYGAAKEACHGELKFL
jgi:hypothetical protein